MICSQCKENQATVFIKTNLNGQESETNLCEVCAKKYNEAEGGPLRILSELLNNPLTFSWGLKPVEELLGLLSKPSVLPRTKIKSKECPTCGFQLKSFQTTGKLGCADCYRQFRTELLPVIRKYQGQIHHKGKKGNVTVSKTVKKSVKPLGISELKSQLEKAVQEENYEEAARLRDQIRDWPKSKGTDE